MLTSSEDGSIKIWTMPQKKCLGEITLPHRVESACFLNQEGDLLIAHDKRFSVLRYSIYWQQPSNFQISDNFEDGLKRTEIRE